MLKTALNISACLFILSGVAQALTVDEVVRLKQAGVSDSTIEMLIKDVGGSRRSGTWKTRDGWIVHSTDTRDPEYYRCNDLVISPLGVVLPRVSVGRR
ncbi:MAG TPA: hypothetical protein VNM15_10145 [Candidatus Binatia bacterium]|nr:hypothetical protein [Candidatus Binatia bacterium]